MVIILLIRFALLPRKDFKGSVIDVVYLGIVLSIALSDMVARMVDVKFVGLPIGVMMETGTVVLIEWTIVGVVIHVVIPVVTAERIVVTTSEMTVEEISVETSGMKFVEMREVLQTREDEMGRG
jgi:hypothetical protein